MFRARLSAFEVSQLSSEFFGLKSIYVLVEESQYEPLLVKEVLSLLLLCEKFLMCEDFSLSNVHFPCFVVMLFSHLLTL